MADKIYEVDDSLLAGFGDVETMSDEDFDRMNEEYEQEILDAYNANQGEQTNQVQQNVQVPVQNIEQPQVEVTQTVTNDTKKLEDYTVEELKSLLPEEELKTLEQTPEVTNNVSTEELPVTEVDANKNLALHIARQKSATVKSENELLKKQLELLNKQLDMQNNQIQQTTAVAQPEVDIFANLDDDEMVSKKQVLEAFRLQEEKNRIARANMLEAEFRKTHGPELGELSYDNLLQKFNAGEIALTDGERLDIYNASQTGQNAVELFYNKLVDKSGIKSQAVTQIGNKEPDLTEQIKKLIAQKTNAQGQINTVQQEEDPLAELNFVDKSYDSRDSHLDSLCNW